MYCIFDRLSIGDHNHAITYTFPKRDPAVTKVRIGTLFNREIAVDSIQVSLWCPLSNTRIQIPCRPSQCDHLQCFDLATYVTMNKQSGKWLCPVCGKKALLLPATLFVDVYFLDILNDPRTQNEEAIQVEKDGSWRLVESTNKADKTIELSIGNITFKFPKRDPAITRSKISMLFNSEIAVDSIQVSLRCPLSKTRIEIPCRPSLCDHIQCFDLATYISMNKQSGKWLCPVCGKKALPQPSARHLFVDVYFLDVLNDPRTKSEEAIQVEKDGSWRLVESTNEADKTVELLSSSDDESGSEEETSGSSQSEATVMCETECDGIITLD